MVYCSSPQLWAYRIPDVLRAAADMGYTGVEVWVQQAWLRDDSPQAIRAVAEETGMALTAHAVSWDVNITALHEPIRRQGLAEVRHSIAFAAECGADVITVHPGRLTASKADLPLHWELQVAAFQELGQVAAEHGIRIGIELMEPIPKEFIIHPDDVNRLVRDVNLDHVGVTFDVAHIPLDVSPLDPLAAIERPFVIHLSDASSRRLHLPLGKGEMDMERVVPHVFGLGLPVVIEGFEPRPTRALAAANKAAFDAFLSRGRERQKQVAGGR